MVTGLEKIASNKSKFPESKHRNLMYHVNENTLKQVYKRLSGKKAVGVDMVTKDEYGKHLDENLANLIKRMKSHSYRPQPARREYITKVGSKKLRPLGIPSFEDKLVQGVMTDILNTIYEPLFYDFSYGFRPGRSSHQAIHAMDKMIFRNKVNYIVDADIKGFFDNVNHKILMKFLEEEIGDKSLLRYIVRFLKSGIMDDGKFIEAEKSTPQGALISPILGNVYLHYALDMWFDIVVRKYCKGFCGMVRYADDFVCCFEKEAEAKEFFKKLQERLQKFGLEIEVDKSRLIRFGRKAGADKEKFDFLGFTFINGRSRTGRYQIIRRTSGKKMGAKFKEVNKWLKQNRHLPIPEMVKKLNQKLIGHYRYYGIIGNYNKLHMYRRYIMYRMKIWLGRRSQKAKMTWSRFYRIMKFNPLAEPKIYHQI